MGALSITGGTLRSRLVRAPRGRLVRPTASRVKEALFSILAPRLADARVLDLFAGTGSLGFEALSRGAAFVTFVEIDRAVAAQLRETARDFALADRVQILLGDARRVVPRLDRRYDLVFADPPYAQPPPVEIIAALASAGRIDAASLVIYEHRSGIASPVLSPFALRRSERYGEATLAFYDAG